MGNPSGKYGPGGAHPPKKITINGCAGCPLVVKTYTGKGNYTFCCSHPSQSNHFEREGFVRSDGSRFRVIAAECEWPGEYPAKTFPNWCPL